MSFTPSGFATFLRELNNDLAKDPLDKEQDELGGLVRDSVIENFNDEVDYGGNAWAPRRQEYEHDPLRETFLMFGAATVLGAPGNVVMKSREELILGVSSSEVEYAAYQNFGSPADNLPAREYMFIREEHQERLDEPLEDAMERVLEDSIKKHSR